MVPLVQYTKFIGVNHNHWFIIPKALIKTLAKYIFSDVLERDGTAVDAAIAAMFCNGVYSPHSLGIGGGFFMTLYIAETKEVVTLNAREVAPNAAELNMFNGDSILSKVGESI